MIFFEKEDSSDILFILKYYKREEMFNKLFWYIPAALLFLGIFSLPYDYYTLLRVIVFISALYIMSQNKNEWLYVFLGIAILFNPVLPIYLSKGIWIPIDIIVGILYLFNYNKTQGVSMSIVKESQSKGIKDD